MTSAAVDDLSRDEMVRGSGSSATVDCVAVFSAPAATSCWAGFTGVMSMSLDAGSPATVVALKILSVWVNLILTHKLC